MKRILLAAAVALTLTACGDDSEPPPRNKPVTEPSTSVSVTATDFAFDPDEFEVVPGGDITIEFHNDGENPHSFTAPAAHVELVVEPGGDAAGGFQAQPNGSDIEFFCKFHPDQMNGIIQLRED